MFFGILVMKELYLGSKNLDFFIKFKDLLACLGSNPNLAALSLFDIPMLSHFWADFWTIEKLVFAIKIETLDQIEWNYGFNNVQ